MSLQAWLQIVLTLLAILLIEHPTRTLYGSRRDRPANMARPDHQSH